MLKYLILTSLLSQTEIDVLEMREAKVYAQDPHIIAMTSLKDGIQENNIDAIHAVLNDKAVNLLEDPFIATYLDDLLRTVRLKSLQSICAPYKIVKLSFLAKKLSIGDGEVRSLLSELILEERIEGQIDQINGLLELNSKESQTALKHRAMQKWGEKLVDIHKQLMKKAATKENAEDMIMS